MCLAPAPSKPRPYCLYLSFSQVDEKGQTMTTAAVLELEWDDFWLSWDAATYGGVEHILVPQKKLWVPDVTIGNSMTAGQQLG